MNEPTQTSINCIIIDDEHLAQVLLSDYVQRMPGLNLVAKCNGAVEAIQVLQQQRVDLMFLDIHMPQLNGIEFLKTLRASNRPNVIFTTAYAHYALDSYQYDAIDYLLKPITFERFVQAIQKAVEYIELKKERQKRQQTVPTSSAPIVPIQAVPKEEVKDYIFVKSGYKMVKIRFDDIVYIEGLREYVHIHSMQQSTVTLETLKKLETLLPRKQFIRIHKSYIIAIDKVDAFTSTTIEISQKILPIGRSYRSKVAELYKDL